MTFKITDMSYLKYICFEVINSSAYVVEKNLNEIQISNRNDNSRIDNSTNNNTLTEK